MGLLWVLVFPGLIWLGPGWAASRWLLPAATPLERVATALLLGVLGVTPVAYGLVYGLSTPMTPALLLAVSASLAAFFVALHRWRPRPPADRSWVVRPRGQGWWVVAGLVLVSVAVTAAITPRAHLPQNVFAVCLQESALIMLEDGSGHGLSTYHPELGRAVSHVTARPTQAPGYGLSHILGHQRVGSMAVMAQGVVFHGSGALVVMTFAYTLLVALLAGLLIGGLVLPGGAVVLLAGAFVVGCHEVAAYMVNENLLACGLALGCVVLVERVGVGRRVDLAGAAAAGLCLALAVAVRPIALAFVPGLLVLLPTRVREWVGAGAAALVGALPWALTQVAVFGRLWVHPSLEAAQTPQQFLGFSFTFHPLNWPVAETLGRADFAPFPNLVRLPLEHVAAFGGAFVLLAVLGLMVVPARRLLGLLLMAAPNYLMLLLIVGLDDAKLSYALLSFAPLPVLAGAGAQALMTRQSVSLWRRACVGLGGVSLLVLLPAWASSVNIPIDPRPHYYRSETPELRGPGWADTERRRLLEWGWGPDLHEAFPSPDPALVADLLLNGSPPQRPAEPIAAPTIVWMDHEGPVTAELALVRENALRGLLAGVDSGCGGEERLAGAAFYLQAAGPTVTVRTLFERNVLTVAIEAGGGTAYSGYISLGLHNDQLSELSRLVVTVDGQPIATTLLVRETAGPGGSKQLLRLVSNFDWHYTLQRGQLALLPGADPTRGCMEQRDGGARYGYAPGALLIDGGAQRCRYVRVSVLGQAPNLAACRAVELTPTSRSARP